MSGWGVSFATRVEIYFGLPITIECGLIKKKMNWIYPLTRRQCNCNYILAPAEKSLWSDRTLLWPPLRGAGPDLLRLQRNQRWVWKEYLSILCSMRAVIIAKCAHKPCIHRYGKHYLEFIHAHCVSKPSWGVDYMVQWRPRMKRGGTRLWLLRTEAQAKGMVRA